MTTHRDILIWRDAVEVLSKYDDVQSQRFLYRVLLALGRARA